ncbi:MAG TPA: hypothetical protein VER17_07835 [Tepidisphaeraceae bacterium]|nr:hypothetical protein [Tepidisphaeraceae bacterium]
MKRLAGLGVVLASGVAMAQTTPPQETAPERRGTGEQIQPGTGADTPAPSNNLKVHGLVGVDFPTHYISRGLVLEDQGFIAQPYAELDFTLYEGEGALSKVVGFVGIWNSLHSQHTDAGLASGTPGVSTTDIWYEFDWYVGFSIDLAKNFNLNLSYWEFVSPNDGFGTSKNYQAKVSFNDTDLWGGGGFALKPYGLVFIETDGKAGSGSDEGIYVELGVEPTIYTFGKEGTYPLALSVPARVGLGFSDFYEDDEVFGFATVGLKASVPLAFIPSDYGSWSAYASVMYYFYGEGVDDFNEGTGDGEDDIVAAFGVSMTF